MSDRNLVEQLGAVLKKSRGEPSKFIELIVCIRDLNRQGKIASCSKIVRKLWFEEWKQAHDKVSFEKVKWDLLCKRRRAINNRVLKSDLCFDFYIELSPEKQFILIHGREEIYRKRAEELERNLSKAGSESLRERIQADIVQLDHQYSESTKGKTAACTTIRRWAAAGVIMVLAITSALLIRNIYFNPPLANNHFIEKQSPPAVFSGALTIAVQPFSNLSGDPQQESFSKGLAEEIVTTLSKLPGIDVIDSNSTFAYNEKTVDVKQVRKKIDARYVLRGSIRKTHERARISVQLSDAATGHHLWADRWDRDLDDIFAVQDEITMNIVTELVAALQSGAHVRLFARSTRNLEAFTKVLSGYHYFFQGTLDNTLQARQLCRGAIALDSEYVAGYALLADTYIKEIQQGGGESRWELANTAFDIIQTALAKDDTDALVHNILSRVYTIQGRFDLALAEAKKAVDIYPNSVECINWHGSVLRELGRYKEAIKKFNRALDLNPKDPSLSYVFLGLTYHDMQRYEDAITYLEKFMRLKPKAVIESLHLAASYEAVGRDEEARAIIKKVLRKDPTMTVEKVLRRVTSKKGKEPSKNKQLLSDQLRRAGLP